MKDDDIFMNAYEGKSSRVIQLIGENDLHRTLKDPVSRAHFLLRITMSFLMFFFQVLSSLQR